MEKYPPYQAIFSKLSYGESQILDKAFYEEEVKRLCLSFEQQVCISGLNAEIVVNFFLKRNSLSTVTIFLYFSVISFLYLLILFLQ